MCSQRPSEKEEEKPRTPKAHDAQADSTKKRKKTPKRDPAVDNPRTKYAYLLRP
jgi:hypothetical protein